MKPKRIIVVGGNAAGPAAAAKAKRVNPAADVLLFEAGSFISTGTCEIPYVLSGDIKSYEEIIFFTPEKIKKEKGVDVFVNHLVEEINTTEKYILVKNLELNKQLKFEYDSLVLATGALPKRIPSLPSTLANVFYLTKIKNLIEIKSYVTNNKVKTIAIIGAGFIGMEAADALYSTGYNVIVIEKENLPLLSAEPEMRYLVLDEIKKRDIGFYHSFSKMKPVYEDDKVVSINIDGRIIEFDMAISAAGFVPDASLALSAKLKTGSFGGIKVDSKLKTSDPDIYAAGDNIEVINAVTGRSDYLPFAAIAHEYGHAAGANAAGGNVFVEPVIKNSSIKIFDRFLVSVGITAKQAADNNIMADFVYDFAPNIVAVMPRSEKTYGKIIFSKNDKRILGASFFGGREASGYGDIISALIKLKQPVSFLGSVNYNYTPPLSPMINLLSKLGRKAS